MNKPDKLTVTFVGPYKVLDQFCAAMAEETINMNAKAIGLTVDEYRERVLGLHPLTTKYELQKEDTAEAALLEKTILAKYPPCEDRWNMNLKAEAAEKQTEKKIMQMFADVIRLDKHDQAYLQRGILEEHVRSLDGVQQFLDKILGGEC